MTTKPRDASSNLSLGDTAVDGLLAGTGAGGLMAAYVVVVGLAGGQSWRAIFSQFDPSPTPAPLTGALAHLAVAGVYGVLFAVVWRWLRRVWARVPAWVAGLLYGMGLWILALALLRLSGTATPAGWLAGLAPVHLALAHLLYGAALGWLLGRRAYD